MATLATAPAADHKKLTTWLGEFLRSELAPYPGRGETVVRIVLAAVFTMILIMVFRVPGGASGAIFAFRISGENLVPTKKSAIAFLIALAVTLLFSPIGSSMFASTPLTHFLWEGVSIFLIFFLIRTLTDPGVAMAIGIIGTTSLADWYLPGPAEHNLEQTLWQILATFIGVIATLITEAFFNASQKEREITLGLDTRLELVQDLLACYAERQAIPEEVNAKLTQYSMVGAGRLRRLIVHARSTDLHRSRLSTLVALSGRAVEFGSVLSRVQPEMSDFDAQIAARLVLTVKAVRAYLKTGEVPPIAADPAPSHVTLLREIEEMITLMPRAIRDASFLEAFDALAPEPPSGILVPDAFSNWEHVRFALAGCFAGMMCYIIYVSLAWPGLSTSVTTCMITALSSRGASRQKQFLRVTGALIGGFIFGLGAQIFILPHVDSIVGFTLLFAAVTACAAWIATSSSRLSYCGLQIALAFYLIHLNDFKLQQSLTIGRDRTLGVLLGTVMMWVVYERLQPTSAAEEMMRLFAANLRLLAELAMQTNLPRNAASITSVRKLQGKITKNFAAVHDQADAVPFETGRLRAQHMVARDHIRYWQASLRATYLLQIAMIHHHLVHTEEKVSDSGANLLRRFDQSCARTLSDMATYLDAQKKAGTHAELSILSPVLAPELSTADVSVQLPEHLLSLALELKNTLDTLSRRMLARP